MQIHEAKSTQSRSAADHPLVTGGRQQAGPLIDQRPESLAQARLQQMVNSPRAGTALVQLVRGRRRAPAGNPVEAYHDQETRAAAQSAAGDHRASARLWRAAAAGRHADNQLHGGGDQGHLDAIVFCNDQATAEDALAVAAEQAAEQQRQQRLADARAAAAAARGGAAPRGWAPLPPPPPPPPMA